jgi:hypothetical protein
MGSAWKPLQLCGLGARMHGPRWSNAIGGPGSPHSDSVFRSNTSTDQDQPRRQTVPDGGALFTYTRHCRRDPARQVPPLGVGDPLPQMSRDTCNGTASIMYATGTASAATMQHSAAIFQHGCAIIALQI